MKYSTQHIETMFWAKVSKKGACWVWTGTKNNYGYGMFRKGDIAPVTAHRFSFQLRNGPIPKGVHICHTCDNPPCVRPSHLFAGDNFINRKDSRDKGRIPLAKLTRVNADKIKILFHRGVSRRILASNFGVSYHAINNVLAGRTWN